MISDLFDLSFYFLNTIFFLTTSGEFYSINNNSRQIIWVLNFKNPENKFDIFYSTEPVLFQDKIVFNNDQNLVNIDQTTGKILWNKNIQSNLITKLSKNTVNVLSSNGFLVTLNQEDGDIIWSKKIYEEINNQYKIKANKIGEIISFFILNDIITLFSKNGYMIEYNTQGNILSLDRVTKTIVNKVLIVDGNLIFLDSNNKVFVVN